MHRGRVRGHNRKDLAAEFGVPLNVIREKRFRDWMAAQSIETLKHELRHYDGTLWKSAALASEIFSRTTGVKFYERGSESADD